MIFILGWRFIVSKVRRFVTPSMIYFAALPFRVNDKRSHPPEVIHLVRVV
jgi:hypothetical protein